MSDTLTLNPSLFSFGNKKSNFKIAMNNSELSSEQTKRKSSIFAFLQNEETYDNVLITKPTPALETISLTRSHWERENLDRASEFVLNIADVYSQTNEDNWDGYGAKKLDPISVYNALTFVFCLPSYIPQPDLVAEPNGELGLQWQRNGKSFALSIDAGRAITFGGYAEGGDEFYGTTKFNKEIPEMLLSHIKTIF